MVSDLLIEIDESEVMLPFPTVIDLYRFLRRFRPHHGGIQQSLEEAVALYSLALSTRGDKIFEVGTRSGGSAFIMAYALMQKDRARGYVQTVDISPNVNDSDELEPLMKYMEVTSARFGPALAQNELSFEEGCRLVHLDGDHKKESVIEDLYAIADSGFYGQVVVHDAGNAGVLEAVMSVVGEREGASAAILTQPTSEFSGQLLVQFGKALAFPSGAESSSGR